MNSSLWDSDSVHANFDRAKMLDLEQVAAEIMHLAKQPPSQSIEDLILMPSGGAF